MYIQPLLCSAFPGLLGSGGLWNGNLKCYNPSSDLVQETSLFILFILSLEIDQRWIFLFSFSNTHGVKMGNNFTFEIVFYGA